MFQEQNNYRIGHRTQFFFLKVSSTQTSHWPWPLTQRVSRKEDKRDSACPSFKGLSANHVLNTQLLEKRLPGSFKAIQFLIINARATTRHFLGMVGVGKLSKQCEFFSLLFLLHHFFILHRHFPGKLLTCLISSWHLLARVHQVIH